MPFIIIRQDITQMKTDAIVNAANNQLRMGGGVCGAIFHAAGAVKLQAACFKAAPVQTGCVAITPGFRLPAKYIIHAVGPVYSSDRAAQCEWELFSAYTEALKLAERHHCESIAFPLISSGIYGYPKEEALRVATAAITAFLAEHEMTVYLTVYDKNSFVVSQKLLGDVEAYIDEHYVEAHPVTERRAEENLPPAASMPLPTGAAAPKPVPRQPPKPGESQRKSASKGVSEQAAAPMFPSFGDSDAVEDEAASEPEEAHFSPILKLFGSSLDERLNRLDEPFSVTLLKLIDRKGKTDVEVYKKANLDRKLFSKIRTGKHYTPKKSTILALAIALELTLDETEDLLERAGYALSHASKFDVIVEYFIISRNYDIFAINEVLFRYDQPLLGG